MGRPSVQQCDKLEIRTVVSRKNVFLVQNADLQPLKLYGGLVGKISETGFPHHFAKNDRQELKMGCIDASRRQLQSVLKIRV